jgi:hypothetical protein
MNDLRIHTYTAAEPGILVNSYLLKTGDGVESHADSYLSWLVGLGADAVAAELAAELVGA